MLLAADMNQPIAKHYSTDEWAWIAESRNRRRSPLNDGVADRLEAEGYRNCFDACCAAEVEDACCAAEAVEVGHGHGRAGPEGVRDADGHGHGHGRAEGFGGAAESEEGRGGGGGGPDRNWEGPHPPPTHWTSTNIDHAWSKGLEVVGVYVVPSPFSDHLPVVTDWVVPWR